MNALGQCFSTPLGKALFDNSDCRREVSAPNEEDRKFISLVRKLERDSQCNIDTNRTGLPDIRVKQRLTLQRQPVISYGALCENYRGSPLDLHAAPDSAAQTLGRLLPGDTIRWSHQAMDGWMMAEEINRDGKLLPFIGWHSMFDENQCETVAG